MVKCSILTDNTQHPRLLFLCCEPLGHFLWFNLSRILDFQNSLNIRNLVKTKILYIGYIFKYLNLNYPHKTYKYFGAWIVDSVLVSIFSLDELVTTNLESDRIHNLELNSCKILFNHTSLFSSVTEILLKKVEHLSFIEFQVCMGISTVFYNLTIF